MRKYNGLTFTRLSATKKRAFTLIELLVVIAIIALLVSILLPSLKKAKDLARRAVCMSQMKAIVWGFHLYADEFNSRLPWAWDLDTGERWETTIPAYMDADDDAFLGMTGGSYPTMTGFMPCPSDERGFKNDNYGWLSYGVNTPTVIAYSQGAGLSSTPPPSASLEDVLPSVYFIVDAVAGYTRSPSIYKPVADSDGDDIGDSHASWLSYDEKYNNLDTRHLGSANFGLVGGSVESRTIVEWAESGHDFAGLNRMYP